MIPTIGIGAGPDCDAQVLVWSDMAGMNRGRKPQFVKPYADVGGILLDAARRYAAGGAGRRVPGRGALLHAERRADARLPAVADAPVGAHLADCGYRLAGDRGFARTACDSRDDRARRAGPRPARRPRSEASSREAGDRRGRSGRAGTPGGPRRPGGRRRPRPPRRGRCSAPARRVGSASARAGRPAVGRGVRGRAPLRQGRVQHQPGQQATAAPRTARGPGRRRTP